MDVTKAEKYGNNPFAVALSWVGSLIALHVHVVQHQHVPHLLKLLHAFLRNS